MRTAQEIFDISTRGIIKQGGPALSPIVEKYGLNSSVLRTIPIHSSPAGAEPA